MVVEDKMQSLISGLGGEEWLEGKISWRWNYREIGVPADRVCEGTIEKISFGLVRVEGLGEKASGQGLPWCLLDRPLVQVLCTLLPRIV